MGIAKQNHLKWGYNDNSIFYRLQADYGYIYIYNIYIYIYLFIILYT